MNESLKTATLEFLRVVALAVVPVLIMSLEGGWDWKPTVTAVLIAGLRAVDKFGYTTESKLKLPF